MSALRSRASPQTSGVCTRMPKTSSDHAIASSDTVFTAIPSGSARPSTTTRVCGKQVSATRNTLAAAGFFETRRSSVMASPAAVPSSSSEAFATSMAVRSRTTVWKLRRPSSRPWAISAWYGV